MTDEMKEAIEAMEANEPQANLYRAAEEYVSDQAHELMGIADDEDFKKLAELMKQAVLYGAHWKEQQMMKNLPAWKNGTPPQKGWWLTRTEHKEGLISIACVPFRDDGWPYRNERNVLYMDMNDLKDLPKEDVV